MWTVEAPSPIFAYTEITDIAAPNPLSTVQFVRSK